MATDALQFYFEFLWGVSSFACPGKQRPENTDMYKPLRPVLATMTTHHRVQEDS